MLTPGTDFPLTSTNQRRSSCNCASYLVKTILNLIIIAHETNPSQIKSVIKFWMKQNYLEPLIFCNEQVMESVVQKPQNQKLWETYRTMFAIQLQL